MAQETVQKNKMQDVFIDKVTVNVCVGNNKQGMDKAEKLLRKLTDRDPVKNTAKKRLNTWQIRPGLPIGFKVTLRGEEAHKFLKWMIESKDNMIKSSSFDNQGNFAMGFHEYLELNGIKYDAEIGVMGFELMVTFARPGYRIRRRVLYNKRIPQRHRVSKEDAIEYMKSNFKVEVQ